MSTDPRTVMRQYMRLVEDDPTHFLAPDVGTIFEYHGQQYRVDGWLKERLPPVRYKGQDPIAAMIDDTLYDTEQEIGPKKLKLRWCFRKDATHVSGVGIAGVVAPIEDIKVIGRVNWKPEMIDDERRQANWLAAHGDTIR